MARSRIKLSDQVNARGQIMTASDLLDAGLAYVEMVDNFHTGKRGPMTKYFVTLYNESDEIETSSGWEISKYAYMSRAAIGQDFDPYNVGVNFIPEPAPEPEPDPVPQAPPTWPSRDERLFGQLGPPQKKTKMPLDRAV
jgi:hypothetical protein